MYGVGEITAAQLMAEIGDVRRFPRRSSIVGICGCRSGCKPVWQACGAKAHLRPNAAPRIYGKRCTKSGYLRKAQRTNRCTSSDKKRAEGKPYFVYMTAAQNKFLRIYYARVKECLEDFFDAQQNPHRVKLTANSIPAGDTSFSPACFAIPFFRSRKFAGLFFLFGY